jgi:Holliday junction resolvase RusA-like endonuclease
MFQKWRNELKKTPLEGAIHIIARFIFARPKSVSEKKRKFYTIKPDIDNVAKAIGDAGNGIIWKDDAQIVAASFFKDYGDTAKVFLSIKEVI